MFEAMDDVSRTELALRKTNGITVRLLWSRSTNLVTVAVDDAANDDHFELILGEQERALDVFHHPFAHAAAHARYGPQGEARAAARRARIELRELKRKLRRGLFVLDRVRGLVSVRSLGLG